MSKDPDQRDHGEPLPEGWGNYQSILTSQIQPGSQIKVITRSGAEYVFTGVENGFLRLDASTSVEGRKFVGQTLKAMGGITVGERMLIRIISDGVMSGIGPNTSDVNQIQACNVGPDTITPVVQEILRDYFPGDVSNLLQKAGDDMADVMRDAGFVDEINRMPDLQSETSDHSTITAQVSAAILELFNRLENGDIQLSPEKLEYIGELFGRFMEDYGIIADGPAQLFQKKFIIQVPDGKREYEMKAVLYRSTGHIGQFELKIISGEGEPN